MITVAQTDLDGVLLVEPKRFRDERGFFSEVYNAGKFAEKGIETAFTQDNHSLSVSKGTIRGLHFQAPPYAQAKLVRAAKGAIYDVAVDIRVGSPTYGRWIGVELSADNWRQLFIPAGFAHGFCTLTDDVEVLYKVDSPYSPEHDHSIAWNDPTIGIDWPVEADQVIVSSKDAAAPKLNQLPAVFQL